MRLKDLGEFNFIDRFCRPAAGVNQSVNLRSPAIGIGDDCAVIPLTDSSALLMTTDMLIEGTHFLFPKITAFDLGYKCLAVNLSDIAAMGGKPLYAFLSLALPKDLDLSWVDSFFAGWRSLAEKAEVQLLGGDTTSSAQGIAINVLVVGQADPELIKYRSAAKPGDIICVDSYLGESAAGLRVILDNLNQGEAEKFFIQSHYRPEPHLAQGQFLAQTPGVHAMMDVSDGIDSDIQRIMAESSCGAIINLEKIPRSPRLIEWSDAQKIDHPALAVAGGEDYCLLFTVEPSKLPALQQQFEANFAQPIFPVGVITDKVNKLEYLSDGMPTIVGAKGFDNFL